MDEGIEKETKGRSGKLRKTVALDPMTYQVLQYLKDRRGFRTFDELLRDMIRVYTGLADPDGARRVSKALVVVGDYAS
ncbi:MAG: hypothetical protein QW123_02855 [Desulfurococcaceae archaeon]